MLCFSDNIAISYVLLLVPDRQRTSYRRIMELPRSVKVFLILECYNSDQIYNTTSRYKPLVSA